MAVHLTTAELLRVRDGRMYVMGSPNARPLRDLRAHVAGCAACTEAVLELYETKDRRRGIDAVGLADAGAQVPLGEMRERRERRVRARGEDTEALPPAMSGRRMTLIAVAACVTIAVALYLLAERRREAQAPAAAPAAADSAAPVRIEASPVYMPKQGEPPPPVSVTLLPGAGIAPADGADAPRSAP